MKRFIRAEEGENNSVIFYDEDGNKLVRYWKSYEEQPVDQASTRSWRNNNPGNHCMGPFARRNGAIGEAGLIPNKKNKKIKFAVYPDYETGRNAQATLLIEGEKYIDLTLNQFVRRYTGVESNEADTDEVIKYRKAIKFFTKLDMDRTIRSLNCDEYEKLLDAMKKHEGWREGREEPVEIKKVQGVRLGKKHTISEFLVGNSIGQEWLFKKDAIELAKVGILYVIIVHTKGEPYLRPKYHQIPFKQMIC